MNIPAYITRARLAAEKLKRFDEASNHPYECRCEICKEWWTLVPPEDDDDDASGPYLP